MNTKTFTTRLIGFILLITCNLPNAYAAGLDPGCITTNAQAVVINTAPPTIYATAASGGSCGGSHLYQWQISTDNIYFTDIPGATAQNLNFSGVLSQSSYFQRRTRCGGEIRYTPSISFWVVAFITYYNVEKNGKFLRNNCGTGYTTDSVSYIVAAYSHSSTVSQAIADSLAQTDVDSNGQAYANVHGICTEIPAAVIYARIEFDDPDPEIDSAPGPGGYDSYVGYTKVFIRFYADLSCTVPLVLDTAVSYGLDQEYTDHDIAGNVYSDGTVGYASNTSIAAGNSSVQVANDYYFYLYVEYSQNYPYDNLTESLESATFLLWDSGSGAPFTVRPPVFKFTPHPYYYY